jgi:hypothetical protein
MGFADHTVEDSVEYIRDDGYELVAAGADAPTTELINHFATEMGAVFPTEYVAFSTSKLGGLQILVKEEIWPPPTEFQVGPAWTFKRGLFFHGIAKDIPEWMDQRSATERIREDRPEFAEHHLVPFMKIYSDPNIWCFTASGSIVRVWIDSNELEEVDQTFHELVHEEFVALDQRKTDYMNRNN